MLQFFRLQKLNRNKIAYYCSVYVDVRSCFRRLLLLLLLQLLLLLKLLLLLLQYTAGWSCSVLFFSFQLSCESCTSMMDVVRTLRKVPGTNTNNEKNVRSDYKMCCCCRFCCGWLVLRRKNTRTRTP